MREDPIAVTIGGVTHQCPPMPFFCLEKAWPHIQDLGRMGAANQALAAAQMRVRQAESKEQHEEASAAVRAAQALVDAIEGDLIGQTRATLKIVTAALSLSEPAPSYDSLARTLKPGEIEGLHLACGQLLEVSGLKGGTMGEATATDRTAPSPTGADTSPS